MAINPDNITTIRVDQLPDTGITLESLIPHTNGTELNSSTVSELVTLVASAIESGIGVGFLPVSVTDGQTLPAIPTDPSFILVGAGTYINLNGFPDLICTEELNAIMSLSDHWEIAVEIPIVAPVGVQTVTGSAVDNTDPQNPVIDLGASSVTSVNSDTGAVIVDLQSASDEGNETTNDVIFRLDADKYVKINNALQRIELWDETIDDTIPITHWDKDSIYIKDALGNQMSISAGYTNNLTVDGSSAEILGGNIVLNQSGNSLNLISEAVQITVGLDTTQYFYDKISVNGVDYTLPTGASSQIATLLDIPSPITIDAIPTDGSSNAVSSNGVFDALATKVSKSDYTPAHSILVQQSGTGTPTALSVGNNTLVGRLSGGGSDIDDLSVSDVRTLLDIDTDLATKVTFWSSAVNGDTVSNTLTITPTYSQLIPANTFVAGDVVLMQSRATSPGAKSSSSSLIIYTNDVNDVSGATQIGIFTTGATGRTPQIKRILSIKGSTSKVALPVTTPLADDIGAQAAMATLNIDWTVDQYILFAIAHTVADQTLTGDMFYIQKM